MPRRQLAELTKEQVWPGFVLLDRTLGKSHYQAAARQFQFAALEYREFLDLIALDGDDDQVGAAELSAVYYALTASALLLYMEPRVRRRFVGVLDVQKALTAMMGAVLGRNMALPLRMHRPRGPRPGPSGMTQEQFEELEPSTRQALRNSNNGREPRDADMWLAIGLSRAAYYRLKAGTK